MYFPLLGTMPNLSLVSAVAAEAPAQRQAQNCGAPTTSRETPPSPLTTTPPLGDTVHSGPLATRPGYQDPGAVHLEWLLLVTMS